MNEVQPLSPDVLARLDPVPSTIIAVFNQLIKQNWNGTCSIIRVNEALGILRLIYRYSEDMVRRNNWIEATKKVFTDSGYQVETFGEDDDECLEFKRAV